MSLTKTSTYVSVFCAVVVSSVLTGPALAATPLEGAWLLTETEDTDGNVDSEPHRGLMVFTSDHYSLMFARGDKPRALFDGIIGTDEELLEAYRSIVANSGRYEVEGNQFTIRAYVAMQPNHMNGWPENTVTFSFSVDGDILKITYVFGPATGAKQTFRRVEGTRPPWE